MAVVVMAGLAGLGGAHWTGATFTDTKTVTGNTLGTATLQAPTALVVTANAATLVLTWGVTPSTYADGYFVYRAAASGGPYTNVATVAGRATATWIDAAPLGGTNWYKLTAYRYNWLSAETTESQGTVAVPSVLTGTLTDTSLAASWTAATGATSYILTRAAAMPGGARFNAPSAVAAAADGTVYVADSNNNRICKVTAAGVVTTLAGGTLGSADGTGAAAQFSGPYGVAVAADGTVYVADTGNSRIRKVTVAGVVTTLAGSTGGMAEGTGAAAQFSSPYGVAVVTDGTVYVADSNNNRIRKVTAAGVVTTLAGLTMWGTADGTGITARFDTPTGITAAADGTMYVADSGNNLIRKVTDAGVVTTLAGEPTGGFADGAGAAALFTSPWSVAVTPNGATVYVADTVNNRIRKITAAGAVTTLAGSGAAGIADADGAAATFSSPRGIAVTASSIVSVADTGNHRIRKISGNTVSTLAGSSLGSSDSVVASAVYSGAALVYTDTPLVAGTSYTYTVTAVGPGTVSNTIGPFVPAAPPEEFIYNGGADITVPAGKTTVHIVLAGGSAFTYNDAGCVLFGDMTVVGGDVLHFTKGSHGPYTGGDATLTKNGLAQAAFAGGGDGNDQETYPGSCTRDPAQISNYSTDTNTSSGAYLSLTYGP